MDYVLVAAHTQSFVCDFEKQGEQEREEEKIKARRRDRRRDRQGWMQEWSGWRIVSVFAAVPWRGVLRCGEITGCRRCLLTFAVHHTVVFVVFRSLPSHIQQPPGAGAQHHRDRALRLLDGDR